MTKVLIFCPEKPYSGAESLVTAKLMHVLQKRGWHVDMIFHITNSKHIQNEDLFEVLPYTFGIENKGIERLLAKFNVKVIKKFLNFFNTVIWSIKSFYKARSLHRKNDYHLIISRIMPQYGHLPALLFKLVFKDIVWIANWSDPFPHCKAPFPYGGGIQAKSSKWAMFYARMIVNFSNWNSFPCDELLHHFLCYLPELKSKSFILPHLALQKTLMVTPQVESNSFLKIVHLGGFGLRNPRNLIIAVNMFKKSHGFVPFNFVFGGFIENDDLLPLITEYGLNDNFDLRGRVSYSESIQIIKNANICMVLEAPLEKGIFLPSKLMDYLEQNKPIWSISPRLGVMNSLIEKYKGGVFSDCTSPEKIQLTLEMLYNENQLIKFGKDKYNVDNLISVFNEDKAIMKFDQLLGK